MANLIGTIKYYAAALKKHPPTPEPPKDLRGGSAQDRFGGYVRHSTQGGGRMEVRITQSGPRANHTETIVMLEDGAEDLYTWLGVVLGK